MENLENIQKQILKHHGGDGEFARERITETYARRHDETFWQFWDEVVAMNYKEGDGILDMGAGTGQFVQACADRYPFSPVFGIEVAPYMLEHQLSLPENARMLVTDLNDPVIMDNAILPGNLSMVMMNMVVHELTQPVKMFKTAYEYLKPGGRLCVIDIIRQPLKDYLERRYSEVSIWQQETTKSDLEDAFEHFLEHNRYHSEDIEYMLVSGGFNLVFKEHFRHGRFVKLVVEK